MNRRIDEPEYTVWRSMKQRCLDAKCKSYKDYGGRGISIDQTWGEYEKFLADMGRRPTPHHTIERIDNNGNYGPSNCRWATKAEQSRNRRNVTLYTSGGETLTLRQWALKVGLKYRTLHARVVDRRWNFEAAIQKGV